MGRKKIGIYIYIAITNEFFCISAYKILYVNYKYVCLTSNFIRLTMKKIQKQDK